MFRSLLKQDSYDGAYVNATPMAMTSDLAASFRANEARVAW
jgi:hypothetical protein